MVGSERRKLVTKYLCSRAGAVAGDFRLAVDVETGELKFWSPVYKLVLASPAGTLAALLHSLTRQLRLAQEQVLSVVLLADAQFGCLYPELRARTQERRWVQTCRFSKFMNVFLNLASETANEELDLTLNLRREADSFQRLKEDRVAMGPEMGSVVLFSAFGPREAGEGVRRE